MSASFDVRGQTVTLPCVVRDASSAVATYLVPTAAARRFIPSHAVDLVEILPGRALLSLAVIDYRDNDLGDYDEISLAFFVRPKGAPGGFLRSIREFLTGQLSTYIHRLPVNQEFTCEAGCRIWGFPKTVEEITVRRRGEALTCQLRSDGRHVFSFRFERATGKRSLPDAEMRTFTLIDGMPHATSFSSGAEDVGFGLLRGADLELGDHPIADELRSLGLPKRPLMTMWLGRMHGCFGSPKKL